MVDDNNSKCSKFPQETWTVVRKIFSTILTLGALGLILYAIGKGYAALPGHWAVHYALLIFVIVLLGYLEGLQVAILEMEHSRLPTDAAFQKQYKRGIATLKLGTANQGVNVQRFLIGRQFFVVFVVFLCAQLTTFPTLPKTGWPNWLFVGVIETGLPGALVVLSFGQLMPQLIAASHPLRFMNIFFTWSVVKLALVLESIGIAHFSWVLASTVKCCAKWKDNENIQENSEFSNDGVVEDAVEVSERTYSMFENRYSMSVSGEEAVNVAAFEAGKVGREEVSATNDATAALSVPPWISHVEGAGSKYKDWGYNPLSGAPFPGPEQIVDYLVSEDKRVPRYLLPPSHPKHIPPHVVAYDLLKREEKLEQKCVDLELKIRDMQKSENIEKSKCNGDSDLTKTV